MINQRNRKLLLPACLLVTLAPGLVGHAQGLYQQCPSLTAAGSGAELTRQLAALKDKEPKARAEAAQQLGKSCDQRAVEPLVGLLKDSDPGVRVAAVEGLGQLGDRAAVEALIAAISDEDWRVRQALGRSLCSFQFQEASYAALNSLASPQEKKVENENDLRARCAAILAINQLNDVRFSRKAVSFLLIFLDDSRPEFHQILEQTMHELKGTRNGPHELIGILKQNNSPDFRQKAAYWIGKLGIEKGRPALGEASVGDRDARVRQTAADALASLKQSAEQ